MAMSFQTHPQPLNYAVEVQEPSSKHMLCKHVTWNTIVSGIVVYVDATAFSECQASHSPSACFTSPLEPCQFL